MIAFFCAGLPILGILVTLTQRNQKRGLRNSLLALVLVSGLTFLCSTVVLVDALKERSEELAGGFFVSDPSSRLFLVLISAVFLGVALYVYNRVLTHPFAVRNIQAFVRNVFLFYSLSALAVLGANFILIWIVLEGTALAAVPLIYHQKGPSSVRAAWKYFLFSSVGLGLVLLGFVCLSRAMHAQGLPDFGFFFREFSALNSTPGADPWRELGLVLILLGFGSKLGLAPMYTWLPETYDLSPPSVTALLSAIQFNAVILAVFRVFQYFQPLESSFVRYEMIVLGLASVLISAFHIVVARNYKRLISYASINHAGVIAIGLGLGRDAAYGVVLYVISNALVKALLFLTCGNIKARYRTKSIDRIHGLIKEMPASGWFFMVGIFALLGFAPFGSFFGEVLIMKSMIDGHHFGVFAVFCLLTTVVFVAMGRAMFPMIWGEPVHQSSQRGESAYMLLPSFFFVFLLLTLGIYLPAEANALLQIVAAGVGGS